MILGFPWWEFTPWVHLGENSVMPNTLHWKLELTGGAQLISAMWIKSAVKGMKFLDFHEIDVTSRSDCDHVGHSAGISKGQEQGLGLL